MSKWWARRLYAIAMVTMISPMVYIYLAPVILTWLGSPPIIIVG